ncbi:hypothetical protein AN964_16175 [Heyndrickxia shackletonii]|uniref:Uncharacterized protein n=1 Tax=Heyndrickxia shackletonii TaxID=157838 RepID=A0A0Q3TMD4_9BACI|nr:spore germination protein [Heyndrickxia shackletonii]KQL54889.1 hypothetical protein AN964_16175 [Heyndrickxia shackletonii]NEY99447.1 spore germination protein [Heyndrickxia shackletonii]
MPAFLSKAQILNIGGTADVHFGDTKWLSPKEATNNTNGVSGGNIASLNINNNLLSLNKTLNSSIADQEIEGNK